MKRVLWVPSRRVTPIEVIDLDEVVRQYSSTRTPDLVVALQEGDPYRTYRALSKDPDSFGEKVKISYLMYSYMFVDDSGHLRGLPINFRATQFYKHPPGIAGDAMICFAPLEYGEDGPSEVIRDPSDTWIQKVKDVLNTPPV